MNYLLSATILFLALVPQNQKLPEEFYRISKPIREKARLIITGTYSQGRTPCIFMPDGTRRWFIESRFQIKKVYRGLVEGKSICINKAMLPKTKDVSQKLEEGCDYLVLLQPDEESMKLIKTEKYISFREALHDEEILAIVKLK